jgi:heat shock protein HslJ
MHAARRSLSIATGSALLLVLQGCTVATPGTATYPASSPVPTGAPTLEEIAGATVAGIYDEAITLVDGRWEGPPFAEGGASRPRAGIAGDLYLSGDLDGDGDDEAVVVLWESSGGSGSYSFVSVFGRSPGGIVNLGTARIGDRVQISSARIGEQVIEIEVVQQGPGDGACCPSQAASRRWTLEGDGLSEQEARVHGSLSLADIAGVDWRLVSFDGEEALPEGFAATLRIDGDRVTGHAPCNRYFGSIRAGEHAGEISIGQVGATRMYCEEPVMSYEDAYLGALPRVQRFGFHLGLLALTFGVDGEIHTARFAR